MTRNSKEKKKQLLSIFRSLHDGIVHSWINHSSSTKANLCVVHPFVPGLEDTLAGVGLALVQTGDIVVVNLLVERFMHQIGIGQFIMVVIMVVSMSVTVSVCFVVAMVAHC